MWITRASPGAEETARRLRDLGCETVVAPVLAVRHIPAAIDLAGVGALAFTSANAVRAFAALTGVRDLAVFAVGNGTARAAGAAGFAEIVSADGDVAALARLIAARNGELEGAVLHPTATEPAGDLVGELTRAGIAARRAAIYETVAAEVPSDVLDNLDLFAGVVVHSPRAGRRLAKILRDAPAPHLRAWCLSPAVAATLAGLAIGPVIAAPLPSEDALLSLIIG
ncbi:MAG TPA: uroporphyrinogen-III synthase [Caulobacteraceae bacterium]